MQIGSQLNNRGPIFGQCECRTDGKATRLRRYSELPYAATPHTFANFNLRHDVPGLSNALQAAQDFAAGHTENNVLTFSGPNGLGKSHLLEAIGWDMLAQGCAVKFTGVSDLLDQLRATFDPEAPETLFVALERYKNADVLLLDDIKTERVTDFAREQLTHLVDQRYRYGGLLVVTTKFSESQIGDAWTSHLADRLFDENSGVTRICHLRGPSYRTGRTW